MKKLVLAGLVAAAAAAYRRRTTASAPDAGSSGSHLRAVPPHEVFPGDDQGGSSPDEAASDLATEAETHPVTLPDQPLEEVDLTAVPDPDVPSDSSSA